MSQTLKELLEVALAKEFCKNRVLRSVTPQIWKSNFRVKKVSLSIQATPRGEEMVFGCGIYMVDCRVQVQGRAVKTDPTLYIAEVDKVFAEWGQINLLGDERGKAEFAKIFVPHGVFVHGVIPQQSPATLEGDNRVDNAGITLVAHKL